MMKWKHRWIEKETLHFYAAHEFHTKPNCLTSKGAVTFLLSAWTICFLQISRTPRTSPHVFVESNQIKDQSPVSSTYFLLLYSPCNWAIRSTHSVSGSTPTAAAETAPQLKELWDVNTQNQRKHTKQKYDIRSQFCHTWSIHTSKYCTSKSRRIYLRPC